MEIYPRIPWELVVDPLGSAEHTLGTAVINYRMAFCDSSLVDGSSGVPKGGFGVFKPPPPEIPKF
jgi:hypothetical protein